MHKRYIEFLLKTPGPTNQPLQAFFGDVVDHQTYISLDGERLANLDGDTWYLAEKAGDLAGQPVLITGR